MQKCHNNSGQKYCHDDAYDNWMSYVKNSFTEGLRWKCNNFKDNLEKDENSFLSEMLTRGQVITTEELCNSL